MQAPKTIKIWLTGAGRVFLPGEGISKRGDLGPISLKKGPAADVFCNVPAFCTPGPIHSH